MAEKQSEYSLISGLAPRDELAVSLRASSLKGVPGALLSAPHKGGQQARAPAVANLAGTGWGGGEAGRGWQEGGGKWGEDKTAKQGNHAAHRQRSVYRSANCCSRYLMPARQQPACWLSLPTGDLRLREVAATRQQLPAVRCPRPACHLGAGSSVPPTLSPPVKEPGGTRPVAMAFLECHKCPGSIQIDLCETQPCAKPLPIVW